MPGQHSIFVAGKDPEAKKTVEGLLAEFGWPAGSIIDLGDITGARAAEMYARLYFTLHNVLGTFDFNIAVVRAPWPPPPRDRGWTGWHRFLTLALLALAVLTILPLSSPALARRSSP